MSELMGEQEIQMNDALDRCIVKLVQTLTI